jgi:predicted short-subunit dehydrogenase-like oxidoreductase (DUF2520 family)
MNGLCLEAKHDVIQIIGRTLAKANSIKTNELTQISDNFDDLTSGADVYIICVNDDKIKEIALQITDRVPIGALVVHTSGSKKIDVLDSIRTVKGSLWPIQSLTKGLAVPPSRIPIAVSGYQPEDILIAEFAKTIFEHVTIVADDDKPKLHLAAVMINNFTNHVVALSQQYMESYDFDYELMQPLLQYTISKLEKTKAIEAQTGPARRHDAATIRMHLDILKKTPDLYKIYKMLSESISAKYPKQQLE